MGKGDSSWLGSASIGNKLVLTYFSLTLLSVSSALVAWFGFATIDRSHSKVVEVSTPLIVKAYQLSERVSTLVSLTSVLSMVEDQGSLDELNENIGLTRKEIEAEIAFLKKDDSIELPIAAVDAILAEIRRNVIEQNDAVAQRILKKAKNQALREDALAAVKAILIELHPVLAELQFARTDEERNALEIVEALQRNTSHMETILSELPFTPSKERLVLLKANYTNHVRVTVRKLAEVVDPALREKLVTSAAFLLEQVNAEEEGIFASSLKELSLLETIHSEALANAQLSDRIAEQMLSVISRAQDIAEDDYDFAKAAQVRVQYLLLLFIFLAISIPVLFLLFYLKPHVIGRLNYLARKTEKIASGDLELTINTKGVDELASMAKALSQFQEDLILKRKAEEALKESEERYELAVKGSSVGLWDWDLRNNDLYWSPRFREIVGLSEEDFVPKLNEFEDRLHPVDHDRIMQALREHIESGTPYDVEYRLRRQDGSFVWVHARGQAIWDAEGNALRCAGSVDDISARKEAEAHLRHQEEEQQIILNSVPSFIWYKDLDNNILRLNKAAAQMMGRSIEEVEGKSSAAFFPKELADRYHKDDLVVIESKQPKLGIVEEYHLPDGNRGWLRTDKVPYVNPAGEMLGVIVIGTDITEVKQTQEELAESNKELEQFAYIASHDLQEPLRTISGYVQLIESRYSEQLDEDGKEFMAFIVDGAQRMKTLISDLLVYSRTGRAEIESQKVDLNLVVTDVVSSLQAKIESEKAEIVVEKLPTVFADSTLLAQLMQNLIGNALKFKKENEVAKVAVSYRLTTDSNDASWYQVSVKDNGIGIDEQYFERMFQVFQRLNKRDAYPGTGIGLAICKKAVERHGGSIWAESKRGEGTTFYFTLPAT